MNLDTLAARIKKRYPRESACLEHFSKIRFRNGLYCPLCGSTTAYEYKKSRRYRCGSCKKDFNALSNTVFENAHLELNQYFLILGLLTQSTEAVPLKKIVELSGATEKSVRRVLRLLKDGLPVDQSTKATTQGAFGPKGNR